MVVTSAAYEARSDMGGQLWPPPKSVLTLPAPSCHPRHPGSTAETHLDDLVCVEPARSPGPAWPWECCQVPTCHRHRGLL